MVNILGIVLVFTSLAAAGVGSPNPEKQKHREEVIVKEGHRVVVVEFENDDASTKVSISPQELDPKSYISSAGEKLSEAAMATKEKFNEASSALPNVGQGVSKRRQQQQNGDRGSVRELVCDALGKCKHKIASAIGKTQEQVSEKAHDLSHKVCEVEDEAKEALCKAKDAVAHKTHKAKDKAKDTVSEASSQAKEAATGSLGTVEEVSGKAKEAVTEACGKAKDAVSENACQVKEGAKETFGKAKGAAKDVVDMSKTLEGDIRRNVTLDAKQAEEKLEDAARMLKEEGGKGLRGFLQRCPGFLRQSLAYVFSREMLRALMGLLQLIGFCTAFGACMWITFLSSFVLARALTRQQFGLVQSKVYQAYFWAMAVSVGATFAGHMLSNNMEVLSNVPEMLQSCNLVGSLLTVFANLIYLEPKASKLMLERMKVEKEEGTGEDDQAATPSSFTADFIADPVSQGARGPTTSQGQREEGGSESRISELTERLRKLNAYSSFLNFLTVMSLSWHLLYLAQRLHAS